MIKRSALGRGLGALIEGNDMPSGNPVSNEVSISEIEANPFQPRIHFDEEALYDLANSIKELGIIQPITLRKLADQKYQIIADGRLFGRRRLKVVSFRSFRGMLLKRKPRSGMSSPKSIVSSWGSSAKSVKITARLSRLSCIRSPMSDNLRLLDTRSPRGGLCLRR